MPETQDMELVREFARHNSETAFAELVKRHLNLVYSVALRCTGNPADAEDVAQAVFIILAQKAASLREQTVLAGWLYETTRFTAARVLRTNTRRQQREQEAYMESDLNEADSLRRSQSERDTWLQLSPHLEAAMSKLGESDRTLLVLRFYENKTGPEAAALLGIREDTAHKRAARAIEKLRKFFAKEGVSSTSAIIAGSISTHSVQTAPAALAKSVTVAAIAKGTAAGSSILTLVKGALKVMAWTKAKTAVVVGVGLLLAAGTATVTIKEIKAHQSEAWQHGFDLFVTDRVPPQASILPSLADQSQHASGSHNGKMLGVGQGLQDIVMNAYGIHKAQLIFSTSVPEGNYDFISNSSRNQAEALRQELQRKFGMAGRRESVATEHLILKVKSRNAPGLRRSTSTVRFSGSEQDDSYSGHQQSLWSLVDYLADHLGTVVIDRTALAGNFDIDFSWDRTPEGLKQALLEQTGLELVPSNEPVEFLIVEDVNHPIVGIGAALAPDANGLRITKVFPNSPASEAGSTPDCVIQKINGSPATAIKLAQGVDLIRGPAGSKITLEFISPDGSQTNTVELTRRKVDL